MIVSLHYVTTQVSRIKRVSQPVANRNTCPSTPILDPVVFLHVNMSMINIYIYILICVRDIYPRVRTSQTTVVRAETQEKLNSCKLLVLARTTHTKVQRQGARSIALVAWGLTC